MPPAKKKQEEEEEVENNNLHKATKKKPKLHRLSAEGGPPPAVADASHRLPLSSANHRPPFCDSAAGSLQATHGPQPARRNHHQNQTDR